MSVINDIKKLMSGSRLFADPEKLRDRGGKRGRRVKDTVKVGQGGTLDPLADGVLGAWTCTFHQPFFFTSAQSLEWAEARKI
jgi:tRNA U55 pseudouridine synthase TruB